MWWWVYVTLVVMSARVTLATVTSHMYRKQGHMYAGGDVLVSRKVRSNIECGWECVPPECVGYHIMDKTNGSLQCTTFSFVNNFTQHPDALYYCSGCRNKGENCSKDEQCTEFTPNSTCSPVTSVCTCDEFFEDDGDLCQLSKSRDLLLMSLNIHSFT
ncbi:uncharacterized protein LOC121860395 [Homarus americanus]|uniref:uncharacterized protein LOC121860395 n=1 Tax=Homarus americanus TaxID=6706 RepID=UPI001C43B3F6|nr:uncharacterized protein LOC121860395 [Homarus americanus]